MDWGFVDALVARGGLCWRGHRVGLRVAQALFGLPSLERLEAQLSAAGPPPPIREP